MTLRLSVHRSRWRAHIDLMRATVPDLVPVVKGNGYGLHRDWLATDAAGWADEVALGTVHELPSRATGERGGTVWSVLTPVVDPTVPLPAWVVPTVGRIEHVDALARAGWHGRVGVKLRSSMRRYGAAPDDLPGLLQAVDRAGLTPHAFVLHPPLAPDDAAEAANVDEVERWLALVDPSIPLSVSHVGRVAYLALRDRHPRRQFRLRSGTALWHGDKTAFHLEADVIDVGRVGTGECAGYRRMPVRGPGHLVMVGAGSAHGVAPLADGRSPFHHARRRLELVEPPHMHTSMVVVRDGEPLPKVGDWIDVQRPLITTFVDETVWRDD